MHCAQSTQSKLTTRALAANTTVAVALDCRLAAILTDAMQYIHSHVALLIGCMHKQASQAKGNLPLKCTLSADAGPDLSVSKVC